MLLPSRKLFQLLFSLSIKTYFGKKLECRNVFSTSSLKDDFSHTSSGVVKPILSFLRRIFSGKIPFIAFRMTYFVQPFLIFSSIGMADTVSTRR